MFLNGALHALVRSSNASHKNLNLLHWIYISNVFIILFFLFNIFFFFLE